MSQTYKEFLSIYLDVNYINKCNLQEIDPETKSTLYAKYKYYK